MNDFLTPEVFISENDIKSRIEILGQEITRDYSGRELVIVCVLKGAFIFCADLVKKIKLPLQLEYIMVTHFDDGNQSDGQLRMLLDVAQNLQDKHVIIIEDMVDRGVTAHFLLDFFTERRVASLKLCSLLYRPINAVHAIKVDYLGFEIEDKYVVGYGLDFNGRYRELPYIGVLTHEH